jgi:hypothetical protein
LSRLRDAIARWAAAALLLAAAPAPGAGAEPAVTLRARPASLVLGTAARATIEIDAGGGGPPHVTTNVGRIENLRAVAAGRFEADYVPPREAYPQVAIVAAVVGERYGWTSIPLSGRGVATARSAPHAAVRVTIGGESFGPVRTDWSGEARVQVIAPPGERFAFHRDRPLDLNVPPTVHVHVAAGRLVAPADAEQRLPLYVFAVTAAGAPRAGAPVVLDVSQGTIVDRAERAPGEIVATWRLAPGAAQPATATVRLADEPGPRFAVTVARPGGAPARVTLEATPSRIVAGEEAPVALRVRVVDGAGNPAAAVPRIESDFGEVSAPVSAGDAAWEARLRIPPEIGVRRRVELVAHAAGLEDRVRLELAPADPARLVVSPEAATLVADGSAHATMRVHLFDRFGNPAAAAVPHVVATPPGRVSSEPDGAGAWVVRYRPERTSESATGNVSVRAGSLERVAQVELVPPVRRVSLAPKLGIAMSAGGLIAAHVSAEGAYRPALLDGRLALVLEAGGFVRDRTDQVSVGDGQVEVHGRARYVSVTASPRWQLALGTRQLAWASAGAGAAHVASEVSVASGPARIEAGIVPVVQTAAGWGLRVGRSTPFAEARLAWHADPRFEALRGSLTVLTLALGCRYDAY